MGSMEQFGLKPRKDKRGHFNRFFPLASFDFGIAMIQAIQHPSFDGAVKYLRSLKLFIGTKRLCESAWMEINCQTENRRFSSEGWLHRELCPKPSGFPL
jgi:hypothetical protein